VSEFACIRRHCALLLLGLALLACGGRASAETSPLRVAIIGGVPPLSYVDERGKATGFAVELAQALCETIGERCTMHVVRLDEAVDALAAGKYDFASINMLATAERRAKIMFSKPFYHSVSVFLAKPGVSPEPASGAVAAVRGSAQARYLERQGWKTHLVETHRDIPQAIANQHASAVVVPMTTSLILSGYADFQALGLQATVLDVPELGGDVCLGISPGRTDLQPRLDAAIDRIKRDGRFDRINTKYLPVRLQ